MIRDIEFREYSNNFMNKLKNDLKDIENEDKMLIAADKTTNLYKISQNHHKELLMKNITKDYKKADKELPEKINKGDKDIATKLELDDRIYSTVERQAFITLKDHKDGFENNPKCRLINPTKTELGRVSKHILSDIVKSVKEQLKFNQ